MALVAGVALGQLRTPTPPPVARIAPATPPVVSVSDPATPSDAASADPATLADATPPRLRAVDLATQIRDGTLDGRLVFVDGELAVTPVGCTSLATVRRACAELAIPGVGVAVEPAEPSVALAPAPLGTWLVTVVRAGTLVYLGSLVPDRDVPTSVPALDRQLATAPDDRPQGSLFQANGTLVTNIPSPCNNLCPPPPPYLADGRNWANPALPETGTVVDVARNAAEIPADTERFDGTFLLARGADDGRWQVVARYVPSRAVRVQVP